MIGSFRANFYNIDGGGFPDPKDFCPANGYIINPDLPTPPEYEIPSEETDEKIVLIVSSELDSAISYSCTVSNTGQFNSKIFDMEENLISSTNTNNNVTININLDPALGTPHPNGYSLFKIVITPTIVTNHILKWINTTRTGYAYGGWPLLEAHFYTQYLTSLESAFFTRCKKLKYLRFYSNMDSLATIAGMCNSCDLLKEVYFDGTLNGLTIINSAFAYCYALRITKWPIILPLVTTATGVYRYGGLKIVSPTQNRLPDMPLLADMRTMFEYNNTIEYVEIDNDFPELLSGQNFVLSSKSIKVLKFTGSVGKVGVGANFDWVIGYNDLLTEFYWPPTCYLTESSQATQGKQCYNLKKVYMPNTMYHYSNGSYEPNFLGTYEQSSALEEFVNVISVGGNDASQRLFFYSTPKLKGFNQPLMKIVNVAFNGPSSTIPFAFSYFECDWAAIETYNIFSAPISFIFRYCSFDTTEINRIFTALPVLTGSGTIDFRNNPGYATCDKTIATAKGWTVL